MGLRKRTESTSASSLPDFVPCGIQAAVVNPCASNNYRSAGAIKFISDVNSYKWFILEVNTRLQVKHGITGMVFGLKIVQFMTILVRFPAQDQDTDIVHLADIPQLE